MKTFSYVVKDAQGIHARPAGILVGEAKKYTSNIAIASKGRTGDLKKLFGVMGLCVKAGDEITLTFTGADEDAAYEAIKALIEKSL